jgi:eukaryotic-like serine/threonine-protein kinase
VTAVAPPKLSERFDVIRRLGEGGMGVVYEVRDRESGRRLALKTMRKPDAANLYRFKQEFRALAELSHPNLVALYDLRAEADLLYFTMELVEGVDFLRAALGAAADPLAETLAGPEQSGTPSPMAGTPADPTALRALLPALARGIAALHDAGKLHCDLKPSNVLVARDGRVVILDFGLVTEVAELRPAGEINGTAEYMSPEQAAGAPLTPASDWYSFGVMLYEALTGRVPFRGTLLSILHDKQVGDPEPPTAVEKTVPRDLEALCLALLNRDPAKRPGARAVLAALGAHAPSSRAARVFVGRVREREVLERALEKSRDNLQAVAFSGPSGIGKTALLDEFLESVRSRAVVLRSKCWEREAMPYNAIDPLVDALTETLRPLDDVKLAALIPRHGASLARLFPVLQRLTGIGARKLDADPREVRRQAFAAFREVLGRVAEHQPVIVAIDDVQWADDDSGALLEDLVTSRDAPCILLIVTHRDDHCPPMVGLLPNVHSLTMSALPPDDAIAFVKALLPVLEDEAARALAEATGGNPLLIDTLAREAIADRKSAADLHVDELLRSRVAKLGEGARRIVEVVAIAGRPAPIEVVMDVASQNPRDLGEARAAGLLRTVPVRNHAYVDTAHDRVREAVRSTLAEPDRIALHRALAERLRSVEPADDELILEHYLAAGDRDAAADFAMRAAQHATLMLAFDRAVRLHRVALEVTDGDEIRLQNLRVELAVALANAGRSGEAGDAFLDAAAHAAPPVAADLRRRGAEHLLIAGHINQGLRAIEEVARTVGVHLPGSPIRALASLLFERLRLRLRGVRFRPRAEQDVSPTLLHEIDVCRTLGKGLGMVETIRGAVLQTRATRLALSAGEPRRVAMTLAYEAGFVACGGVPQRGRAMALLAESSRIAVETSDPHAIATVAVVRAIAEHILGEFEKSLSSCDDADMLLTGLDDVQWERDQVALMRAWGESITGRHGRGFSALPKLVTGARDRGDRYLETSLRVGRTVPLWLSQTDDPHEVRRRMQEAISAWNGGYNATNYFSLLGDVEIDLHLSRGSDAWSRVVSGWRDLSRSMLLEVEAVRVEAYWMRARAALAAAALSDDNALRRVAARDARAIRKCQQRWARGAADLIDATIAAQRGNEYHGLLLSAARAFEAGDLRLHAAVARARAGDSSNAAFAAEGVRNVDCFVERIAPGFRRARAIYGSTPSRRLM